MVPNQFLYCTLLPIDVPGTAAVKPAAPATAVFFSVQPNPSRGNNAVIRFKLNGSTGAKGLLRTVSVNGITIWQKAVTANAGINTVTIDNLATISDGSYFVQFISNQEAITTKMLVQH